MMWKCFLVGVLLAPLSACGSPPSVCGEGTEVEHEERSYCVYDTEAITEEGFRCPDAFQFRFDFQEFTACGANGAQPAATFEQFVHESLGLVRGVGADAGADASSNETALTATLPILEILDTSVLTGSTGCIIYRDGVFSPGTTSFQIEGAHGPMDQDCVFVFFETLGDYDEVYPDFFLISSDAWAPIVEGLTRNGEPTEMRDPNDTFATSSDNFVVPGSYPFLLYAEDPEQDRRTGEALESGTLETLSYDPQAREMVIQLTVNP